MVSPLGRVDPAQEDHGVGVGAGKFGESLNRRYIFRSVEGVGAEAESEEVHGRGSVA